MTSDPLEAIYGVLGYPVAGNPTQYMLDKAFAHAGFDGRCLTFEVPPVALIEAVRGARALGFRGLSIATPHGSSATTLVDRLLPAAQATQFVNCIFRQGDAWVGENTLGAGFLLALGERLPLHEKRILLCGAGNVARAIGRECVLDGAAEIVVLDRSAERGATLAAWLAEHGASATSSLVWQGEHVVEGQFDILIHATSFYDHTPHGRLPLKLDQAASSLVVADVTPQATPTPLVRQATERGLIPLDGLSMMAHQTGLLWTHWTGLLPDVAVLREAAEEYLSL